MKTRVKVTILAVVAFIILFAWGRHVDAAELEIGLGHGAGNTEDTIMEVVTLTSTDLHWYAQIARFSDEGGANYLGEIDRFSGGYRVNWRRGEFFVPYMRLGVAYFDQEPSRYISDRLSYDMAIGVRCYGILNFEYQHNSTAGRARKNWGLDHVVLSFVLPFGASK